MTITIHKYLVQGSDEWLTTRRGILTASEMKQIITPANLKPANNSETRSHLYELLAQRVSGYVEPFFISDDMLRGTIDEIEAKSLYNKHYSPAEDVGFITNDKWGFTIGYSPDGLVGGDGLVECKSRRQKFQVQTIIEDKVPDDYMIQIQTGLMVSEREWLDFVTYCGGLPLMVKRVYPNLEIQEAIVKAATVFNEKLESMLVKYYENVTTGKMIPTERKIINEGEIQL